MPASTSRTAARLAAFALVLTACTDRPAPVDPAPGVALGLPLDYVLHATGDLSRDLAGPTLSLHVRAGVVQPSASGTGRDSSDVTMINLVGEGPLGMQAYLGLIGRPVVGIYRVHDAGVALGSRAQFYGAFLVLNEDGSRRDYAATSGTVTITAVDPVIRGTFAFHSARYTQWPANLVPGTTSRSMPASADFSGSFTARVP